MIAVDPDDVTAVIDALDVEPAGALAGAVRRLHEEVDREYQLRSPSLVERATIERLVELAVGAERGDEWHEVPMTDRMFLRDVVRDHQLPPVVLS